jgi:hypothetical protein
VGDGSVSEDIHQPTRLIYPDRTLQALGRLAAKVDILSARMGVAAKPSPTPPISQLARDIGEDKISLPSAVRIDRQVDDEGEYAAAIQYGPLTLTIDEAVRLGVLSTASAGPFGSPRWTFSHYLAGVIAHSISVERGEAHPGSKPGRPGL